MCLRVCVYRHRFYCRVCWRRLRHPIGAFHKCVCGGGGVKLHALVNNFPPHPQDWTWYPIGSSLLKPCLCSVGVWEVGGWVGDVVWKLPRKVGALKQGLEWTVAPEGKLGWGVNMLSRINKLCDSKASPAAAGRACVSSASPAAAGRAGSLERRAPVALRAAYEQKQMRTETSTNIHNRKAKLGYAKVATLPGSLERNGLCTFFSSDGLYMMSSGQRLEQRALPWQDHDECLSLQTEQPHTLSGRRGVCPSNHWVKNSRTFL